MNITTIDANNWRDIFDKDAGLVYAAGIDEGTKDHFRMWLSGYPRLEVRAQVGQHILGQIFDDLELIETHSWAELRDRKAS